MTGEKHEAFVTNLESIRSVYVRLSVLNKK